MEQVGPGRPRKYNLKDLFQQALTLRPDESIVIPCRDFRETERTRGAFYRELNAMRRISRELAEDIRVTRIMKANYFAVVISKVPKEALAAFLVKGSGEIEEIKPEEQEKEPERIERLMREDGFSEGEINAYKQSQASAMPEIGGGEDV